MLNDSSTRYVNPEVAMCAQFLEAFTQVAPRLAIVATLVSDAKSSSDGKCAPQVELKRLPSSLRYEFPRPNSTYLVIVNASLSVSQIDSLLRVHRMHSKAIGYTLDDVKGIHLSMCMHCILMED